MHSFKPGAASFFATLMLACVCGVTSAFGLNGTVQTVSFNGPITGQPVTFSLYLPPGYAGTTNRYPLIIHLHGIGGVHNGGQISSVPTSHEAAVAAGLIEPCLIAFPGGYSNSFWADSVNSVKPAETNVRWEIIPYLDANYRTIASRNRRAVQGFSMGGFGAAKFAAKFPDTFCACVIYDGALLTWTDIQQRHATLAAEIFNNSAATFDLYSPWHWLNQNATTLKETLPFRDVVGALTNENRAWRDALLGKSIQPSYVETSLQHLLDPLLNAQGSNSWAFIASAFAQSDASSAPFVLRIKSQAPDVELSWGSQPTQRFDVEHRTSLIPAFAWNALVTNLPAGSGTQTVFLHTQALAAGAGFYRVSKLASAPPPQFNFNWDGTNFTYSDSQRSFTGIMLKPAGTGPFAGLVINHGAGGTVTGYSLQKAREMFGWGTVCIAATLTHVAGGETNPVNMGSCPENLARISACVDVLASLSFVDTNRLAIFGHSMGAFATIGSAGALGGRFRGASITAGGVIADTTPGGSNNATPTLSEANGISAPMLMIHCDADPVVPPSRSLLLQQLLNTNGVINQRVLVSSNSIPNPTNWHNIHNDSNINTLILTNTRSWFQARGVLP